MSISTKINGTLFITLNRDRAIQTVVQFGVWQSIAKVLVWQQAVKMVAFVCLILQMEISNIFAALNLKKDVSCQLLGHPTTSISFLVDLILLFVLGILILVVLFIV